MQNQATTPSRRSLRSLSLWLSICVCLVLAACASVGSGNAPDLVRQRASELWQALVAGEFSRAYTYNTPAYRGVVSPDGYRSRFSNAVVWLGSEVVDVNCPEATRCLVRLRLDVRPLLSRKTSDKISTYIDETWLFSEGQWWYFQEI